MRLPGKIMLHLAGEPTLARVVNRASRAASLDAVVVATTVNPSDEAVAVLCKERNWPCFRGSEDDVLDRYYRAAMEHHADGIVRITADCPLVEPTIIDAIVNEFRENQPLDYASNTLPPRTFPRGLDVEVMSSASLKRAWIGGRSPSDREHVTRFIYSHPHEFTLRAYRNIQDYSHLRWTLDTPEDYELLRRIYNYFCHDRFSWQDVLELLDKHPEWIELNRHITQKAI